MRANFRMQRLFIDVPLAKGTIYEVSREQFNYLVNVLRFEAGDAVLVFNGHDGEWQAELSRHAEGHQTTLGPYHRSWH